MDRKEFQIIYQYLQNNHEEKFGPFIFKNSIALKSNISKLAVTLHIRLADNYHIVYGFSDGIPFSTEISVYKKHSVLERFKHFFEKIPPESAVAFVISGHFSRSNTLIFIKLLARLLGRDEPIDALSGSGKVIPWLSSDGQTSQDILTNSQNFSVNMKTKFVIELSFGIIIPKLAGNALSNFTYIENLDI